MELQRDLACEDENKDLELLIATAICLDNILRTRRSRVTIPEPLVMALVPLRSK